ERVSFNQLSNRRDYAGIIPENSRRFEGSALLAGALGGVQRLAAAGLGRRLGLALTGGGFLALGLVGLALLEHLGPGLVGLGLCGLAGDEAEARQVPTVAVCGLRRRVGKCEALVGLEEVAHHCAH